MQGTRLACFLHLLLLLPCLVVPLSVGPAEHGGPVKREVIQGSNRNWTSRNSDCVTEEYYAVRSHLCCKKCPAGTRVAAHCRKNLGSAKCQPCVAGEEYTKWENGLEKCLPCQTCREETFLEGGASGQLPILDQRQVSPCTPQTDTVCECRAGSFCAPDQACEVCQRCRSHCPEGEITKNCTPTSDAVCGKGKAEAAPTAGGGNYLVLVIVLIVIALVLISVVPALCYKREELCEIMRKINGNFCKRDSADSEHQTARVASPETASEGHQGANGTSVDTCVYVIDTDIDQSQAERTTLLQNIPEGPARHRAEPVTKGCCHGNGSVSLAVGQGDDSLGQNKLTGPNSCTGTLNAGSACHHQADAAKTGGSSCSETAQNTHEASLSAPCRGTNTQEARRHHCTDDESMDLEDLRQCFILLVNEVPIKLWKQYMRKLSLTENEIETAEQNNSKNVTEAHYQMLNTWHQKMGRHASLGILLNTLEEMDLNNTVQNVKSKIKEMKQRK